MQRIIERTEVLFILITIVVANFFFVFAAAKGVFGGGVYNYGRFLLLATTMFAVVFSIRGRAGLRDIVAPLFRWNVSPKWYLFAVLWPLCIIGIVLGGKVLFTNQTVQALEFQTNLLKRSDILLTMTIGALMGEIVWVSYSIRQLSRHTSVFLASAAVAVFWTLWWMPMAYFNFGIVPGLEPIPLLINQTGLALMCGFLYYHSQSALCVFVLQFTVNLTLLVFPVLPTTGGGETYLAFATTYLACSICAYLIWGPKISIDPDRV